MVVIEYFKKLFEGRGFLAPSLVVSGLVYTLILIGVLICNIFLYIIKKKYYSDELKKQVIKEALETGDNFNVAQHYKINAEIVDAWAEKAKNKRRFK